MFTYDDQGNPTLITNFEYDNQTYDYATLSYQGRQLTSIIVYDEIPGLTDVPLYIINYSYNDQGYRTSKTITDASNNSVTTTYTLSGDKVMFETDGTNEMFYTYDYDGTLISFNYNGSVYFYVHNLQGDITKILDSSGIIVVEYMYDAWGNLLKTTGSQASTIGAINPYTYRGYRYDKEINMYYLNSRFYNPEIHRFINADGLLGQQGNILGHNMFAYTQNNPVMYIDISGESIVGAIMIGLAIGGLIKFVLWYRAYDKECEIKQNYTKLNYTEKSLEDPDNQYKYIDQEARFSVYDEVSVSTKFLNAAILTIYPFFLSFDKFNLSEQLFAARRYHIDYDGDITFEALKAVNGTNVKETERIYYDLYSYYITRKEYWEDNYE